MRQLFRYMRTWVFISLLCLVVSWSLPAQAATSVSPKLEQQVLQILREHPEVIIESVQIYQQQQQQQLKQVRQAFLQDLKLNPQTVIGESPTTGANQSKILLIEFSDFQCPYCSEAHKTLKQLLAKHQNEITLVYKHLPLISIHDQALPAAKAAWAASQQGKFWEYHDALFANQKQLGEALYIDTAESLHLDLEKFKNDAFGANNLAEKAIAKDILLADKLGIDGTPFFVINSQKFSGVVQLSNIEKILANAQ
ncbi:thioredoxin domain-containing protein [Calothrix sp. FACHB-1219]|uniref:DsbA family protein n=1 Tax=unclassified Calothrix TaxID=2619626 RepID=UPI0016842D7D|nr:MULTISPECIES: thioredoxin domain-containing protein [unclassified Calothrix]MBD2203433.1 thioredoxin domain-containing protein [Calothrix sp. FACHB-168]MBD2219025.1 thioredoxin domain-containing protein [Calothrix sp. FACHB-1219]